MEKSVLYQDIENISKITNTIYGCYADLHGDEEKMADFKANVMDYLGVDADELEARNAFRLSYGGGSEPNFEKYAIGNGGVNFEFGGKRLAYFYDDESFAEQHVIYHELGHSLTRHLDLYDTEKMDKVYQFCNKGIKFSTNGQISSKFADRATYLKYLSEMQSEGFATAAMILRTPGMPKLKLYWERLRDAALRTVYASEIRDKEYPSMKYYSSMPTEMAIIRKMLKHQLTGKDKQFFTADGNIDFVKLAKEVEATVLKTAYTPHTFQRLLDNDILGGVHESKNGWYRYVLPATLVVNVAKTVETNPLKVIKSFLSKDVNKEEQHRRIDLERQNRRKSLLADDGRQDTALLNLMLMEDNVRVDVINFYKNCKDVSPEKYLELEQLFSISQFTERGHLPKNVLDSALAELPYSLEKKEVAEKLETHRQSLNKLMEKHGDFFKREIPHVDMKSDKHTRDFIWDMKRRKEGNPSFNILGYLKRRLKPADLVVGVYGKVMQFADQPLRGCKSEKDERAFKKELFEMLQRDNSVLYDKKALDKLAAKYAKKNWRGRPIKGFVGSLNHYISDLQRTEYLNPVGFSNAVIEKQRIFETRENDPLSRISKAKPLQTGNPGVGNGSNQASTGQASFHHAELMQTGNPGVGNGSNQASSHFGNRKNVLFAEHIQKVRQNISNCSQNEENGTTIAEKKTSTETKDVQVVKKLQTGRRNYDGYQ